MLARRVDGVVRGLVDVVGSWLRQGVCRFVHWSSKVVRVVLEDVEGRITTL